MNKQLTKIFFTEWHSGVVNQLLHLIGLTVLIWGFYSFKVYLILASVFIMESGHLYNYFKGKNRDIVIKIIPLQIVVWLILAGFIYLVVRKR